MSTKIYNAYRTSLSLEKLLIKFKEAQPTFQSLKEKKYYTFWFNKTIELYDEYKFGFFKPELNPLPQWIKNKSEKQILLYQIYKYVEENIIIEKVNNFKNSHREPDLDYMFSVVILPKGRKNLVLAFTDDKEMLDIFEKFDFLEDYHYQNSTDKPDNISQRNWNKRRKDWDYVLGGNGWGKPIHCGLSYTFTTDTEPFSYKEEKEDIFNQTLPSKEDRAKNILYMKFFTQHYKPGEDGKISSSSYFEVRGMWVEFKKTSDYRDKINEIMLEIDDISFEDIF